ncbi:MAG: ATP-grasp domain-containing protein, partial [Candidatus Omnitrophica bacterium]|nr:ATP-grasp domain-containing protein [Candidatus Omnitrophota bacterium]
MKKKLKVLMLFSSPCNRPRGYDYKEEFADPENMYTEQDVLGALKANGYDVSILGIHNTIAPLFEEIEENRPDVIFNMVEVFNGESYLEKNIAALLEMTQIPYTGAKSDNIFLCNNKGLNKKILKFHKIKIPRFYIFYKKRRVWLPHKLKLPCIVKPLCEEASRGISQASIADSEEAFFDRIKFIHENMNMDAIAEEYIEGRELYVSVIGNKKLTVLPPREMKFGELPEDSRIATYKAKWDINYREKWGIKSVYASKLANGVEQEIVDVCKRAYRALDMSSYLRFDIRVTSEGKVYIIEPNANPCIAKI